MSEREKPIDALRVADLQAFPVWQFTSREGADAADETFVGPVKRIPVANLAGKVVGTQVTLANGDRVWAIVGNVHVTDAQSTELFLGLSLERNGQWFRLARYFDFDFDECGPEAAARFLGLAVDEVFPIHYDIRHAAKGDVGALSGQVLKEPRKRLSMDQILAIAVPKRKR